MLLFEGLPDVSAPAPAALEEDLFGMDAAWATEDLFGDAAATSVFDDEVFDRLGPTEEQVAEAALEALESPALLATQCVGQEDRKKLLAAVSTVFTALVASLKRTDEKTDDGNAEKEERLSRALSRATQSRDRIVATAARAARLKLHTAKSRPPQKKASSSDVPESRIRGELERARAEVLELKKKLAAETDHKARLQRTFRSSFNEAQKKWLREKEQLKEAVAKADRQSLHWQQRAQKAEQIADIENRKAQRHLAEKKQQQRAALSQHIGSGTTTTKKKQSQKKPTTTMGSSASRKQKRETSEPAMTEPKTKAARGDRRSSTTNLLMACSRVVASRVTARERE